MKICSPSVSNVSCFGLFVKKKGKVFFGSYGYVKFIDLAFI